MTICENTIFAWEESIETDMPKKYYFHITSSRWPTNIVLYPRIPFLISTDEHGSPLEPDNIKRICVSDSISGCFSAIYYDGHERIYVTKNRISGSPAITPDAHITGERWILRPCQFEYFGELSNDLIRQLPDSGVCGSDRKKDLNCQNKRRERIKEVLKSSKLFRKYA